MSTSTGLARGNLCTAISGYFIAKKLKQQEVKEWQRCWYVYCDKLYTVLSALPIATELNEDKADCVHSISIYMISLSLCIYIDLSLYIYIEREREEGRGFPDTILFLKDFGMSEWVLKILFYPNTICCSLFSSLRRPKIVRYNNLSKRSAK